MIVYFNVPEMNVAVFDEKSQVSVILKSLPKSFLQFRSNAKMNKIEYNMTTLLKVLQTFQSLKGQKEGKGKGPIAAVEGKEKAKVAIKGKCFHCNVDGHWKRNCPKYLVKKTEKEGATNHVCSSLQETSSFKQLEEGEMTLKVGTGDVILARAVGDVKNDSLPPCESCLEGKMTERPLTGKGYRAKEPLELIHSDLYSLMNVKAGGGFEYFISFIDDYSRYGYLYLMEHKSKALEKFEEYKAKIENLLNDGVDDPLSYKQTMNDVDKDQWVKAMDLEMESMYFNSVWELIYLPKGVKSIGCKWIYKRKRDSAEKV
ncbi:Retrovirus-related Pol polyprotein from transposon TNT 1-94 [Cucumis melo var. makuwa]|uniref:Retrovirus-related Pol polyprotein from transposon TNT 1-94 n=1 Tax=Cucumis melo var. makuwa TaxID=1194695 RepID=A0A5D3CCJ2_CUCMM|nr:Retrovirus-related Pol polyprotein from transposon TNT 1-94 [Cucumis melo var. makuwa]TYK08086.1 Retrovirus-related Pol polyprotein from transposon TNT 1-94 [Cucumis melo var. makuwa]